MKQILTATVLTAVMFGAACTPDERAGAGGFVGLGTGILLADLVDANPAWTIGLGFAGAVIGSEVARNNASGECAYRRADGRVDVRRCR